MTYDTWTADDAQLSVLRENYRASEEYCSHGVALNAKRPCRYCAERNADPVCIVCRKPILDGELVTGQSWDGQGGSHVTCLQASGK